jgi:hypothetical protein
MALVDIASKLHTAVLLTGPTAPGSNSRYEVALVGYRDPGAICGWGMTYGVDADAFDQWLKARPSMVPFITTVTQQQIDDMIAANDPMKTHGYQLGLVPPADTPPVIVDIPYAEQVADLITCTMGNWEGEPTAYAYQWRRDGTTDIGTGSAHYVVTSADIGRVLTCIVTATNAAGSTEAPPSNGVTVTVPTGLSPAGAV